MKNCCLSLFLFLASMGLASAQDIHFSQFDQAPLLLNPSLAATFKGDVRAILNYKDQWRSIGSPYKTYALSYDMGLFKNRWKDAYLGAGLTAFNDKAGDSEMGITQVNLTLSSVVTLGLTNKIALGLQGGFAQRSINYDNLVWDSQINTGYYEPTTPSGEPNSSDAFTFGDFSAGISWHFWKSKVNAISKNSFGANVGAAFLHINRPEQPFRTIEQDKLYSKLVIHAKSFMNFNEGKSAFLPSVLYMQQGEQKEVNWGGMLRFLLTEKSKVTGYKKEAAVSFGGYYRAKDAFIPACIVEVANFSLGISYDVNVSQLQYASESKGGIELSLQYINSNIFLKERTPQSKTVRFL